MAKECLECGEEALHEHHVIPRHMGGTKTVPLCEPCHGRVHSADLSISASVKRGIAAYREKHGTWGPRAKLHDAELNEKLAMGWTAYRIAKFYKMNSQALYRRVRKIKLALK